MRRTPGDDGFTIIELVVALSLLAFLMTSIAALFYGAAAVAVDTKTRTQASGVATRALESMRVAAYAKVGLYSGQTGYSNRCDPTDSSAETVTIGTVAPADARYKPVETIRLPDSALDFTVRKCIVWADVPRASGGSLVDAYKKTIVEVSWTDNGGEVHRIRQRSIVYPGGFGTYAGPQTNPSGSAGGSTGGAVLPPSTPTSLTLTVPPDPIPDTGTRSLNAAWSYSGADVNHFTLQWSDSPSFNTILGQLDTADGNVRSAVIGGLAPFWTYHARVIAHGDALKTTSSPASSRATQTTTASTSGACNVGPLTITSTGSPPSSTKIYKLNNNRLGQDLDLTATFTSACGSGYIVTVSGPTTGIGPYSLPASGASRTVRANVSNATWSPGTYTFVVRLGAALPAISQRTFLICANASVQNPAPNAC